MNVMAILIWLILLQAIWYTETAGIEGPAFGNVNTWKGLGIFCDSFDNDQQVSERKNSFVKLGCAIIEHCLEYFLFYLGNLQSWR